MRKSILFIEIYLVCFYLIISIFSCNKENPIAPPPPISQDTADEYEWRVIPEGLGLYGEIFVSDTSHIYLFYCDGTCYRYDGANIFEEINFNDPHFSVWEANSLDNKNIYFTGYNFFSTQYTPVTIKKMLNGNVIQTWISSEDSTADFTNTLVAGDNDIWYGKEFRPNIYHLSSNNFIQYDLNSGLQFNYLWKDKFNNIYAFGCLNYGNENITMYSYKFNGTGFDRISKDTMLNTLFMFPCGSDLLTRQVLADKLLYFSGINWISYIVNSGMAIYKVGGNSKDSLICLAHEPYPSTNFGFNTYVWKGINWRREKELAKLIPNGGYVGVYQVRIMIYGNHVYFPADFDDYKYLIIGKKNKNKNNYENKN